MDSFVVRETEETRRAAAAARLEAELRYRADLLLQRTGPKASKPWSKWSQQKKERYGPFFLCSGCPLFLFQGCSGILASQELLHAETEVWCGVSPTKDSEQLVQSCQQQRCFEAARPSNGPLASRGGKPFQLGSASPAAWHHNQ